MKFKTRLKSSSSLIDLTPLVDVIFLLLIFFIITSDVLPLKSLNVKTPSLDRDSLPLTTQILIVMDAQNVIYMGSKKSIVDLHSLRDQLNLEFAQIKRAQPAVDPTIVLSIDKRVNYNDFLRLFAIVQESRAPIRLVYNTDRE